MENVKSKVFAHLDKISKCGTDIVIEKDKIIKRLSYRYDKPYTSINCYINDYIKKYYQRQKETHNLYVGQKARILKAEPKECGKYREHKGWINYITKYNIGVAIKTVGGDSYIESFNFNYLKVGDEKTLQVFEDGEWKNVR